MVGRGDVRENERGASLVEFALVLPIFMALMLGMFSGGLAYNQQLSLSHATREGARFGATIPADATFASGTWAENVRDLAIERGAGDLDVSGASVCVSLVQGSPGTVVNSPNPSSHYTTEAGGQPCIPNQTYPLTAGDNGRRVQVVARRPSELEVFFFTMDLNLKATGTAKSESG